MANLLALNQPMTTTVPRVDVGAGLVPGDYVLSLIVVSDRGAKSAPAMLKVTVLGGPGIPPPRPPRPPVLVAPVPVPPVRKPRRRKPKPDG